MISSAVEVVAVESCTAALSNGTSLKRKEVGVERIAFVFCECVPGENRRSRPSAAETVLGVRRQRSAEDS